MVRYLRQLEEGKEIRGVIYARISKKGQSTFSLDDQVEQGEKMFKEFGIITHDIFIDDGVSSQQFPRPSLNKILNYAKKGEIQCMFATDMTRIGRSNKFGDLFIMQLFSYDADILTLSRIYYNDDFTSRIMAIADMYTGEQQYNAITEGRRRGVRKALSNGYWPFRRPWGYRLVKGEKGNKLEKIPGFDVIFNNLLDDFINIFGDREKSKKNTLSSFVNDFNKKYSKMLKKVGEEPLTLNRLRTIFTTSKYIGVIEYEREVVAVREDLKLADRKKFMLAKEIYSRLFSRRKKREEKDKVVFDLIEEYGIDFIRDELKLTLGCIDERCDGEAKEIGEPQINQRGTAQQLYECKECGKRFTIPAGRLRRKIENGLLLSCPSCGITEKFIINQTYDGKFFKFTCQICGFSFLTQLPGNIFMRKVMFEKMKREKQHASHKEVNHATENVKVTKTLQTSLLSFTSRHSLNLLNASTE